MDYSPRSFRLARVLNINPNSCRKFHQSLFLRVVPKKPTYNPSQHYPYLPYENSCRFFINYCINCGPNLPSCKPIARAHGTLYQWELKDSQEPWPNGLSCKHAIPNDSKTQRPWQRQNRTLLPATSWSFLCRQACTFLWRELARSPQVLYVMLVQIRTLIPVPSGQTPPHTHTRPKPEVFTKSQPSWTGEVKPDVLKLGARELLFVVCVGLVTPYLKDDYFTKRSN